MSIPLLDHNEDLKRLEKEGYNISIISGNLVVKGIPYVNKDKKILFGIIYCPIKLSGEKALQQDHTVRFVGEWPCDQFGNENKSFVNSKQEHMLTADIIGAYYFSSKPQSGSYPDFYAKITRYVELLSAPAKSLDPSVTSQKFEYESYNDNSVFKYPDTNSARAEITNISERLKNQKIAIVGLGGTGSYILDFVSKTIVQQISLFDGDYMLNHNAFRSPGAASLDELNNRPSKVSYFKDKYDNIRYGIIPHDIFLNETNVNLLDGHDFVFLAIDNAKSKKPIIDFLMHSKIPFVDLGMGITVANNSLRGQIRKTLITPDNYTQISKISMEQVTDENVYSQNIQISELNALNAILGIIAWKKIYGFYVNEEIPCNSVFIIDEEKIVNET